jgi:outer membrane immunogenic protein
MKLSKALLAISALAISGTAMAADMRMPMKAAPPPVVVATWTGFYLGVNGGYSWGRSETDVGYFNTLTGLPIVAPAGSVTSGTARLDGGVAGGQLGYNWQTSNWVWGLEADLQWSGERGSSTFNCATTLIGGPCIPGFTFVPAAAAGGTVMTLDQRIEWFGTVRARGGFLINPDVLLYATGGLAYGSIRSDAALSTFAFPIGPLVTATSRTTTTNVGWTVGAGIEGKFNRNWSARLEYLYMDLGNVDGTVSLAPLSPIGANYSSNITDHILRGAINYHF